MDLEGEAWLDLEGEAWLDLEEEAGLDPEGGDKLNLEEVIQLILGIDLGTVILRGSVPEDEVITMVCTVSFPYTVGSRNLALIVSGDFMKFAVEAYMEVRRTPGACLRSQDSRVPGDLLFAVMAYFFGGLNTL